MLSPLARSPFIALAVLLLATSMCGGFDGELVNGTPDEVGVSATRLESAVEIVRQSIERSEIHGAVLLVARRGKIILHEPLGLRNAEDGEPMQRDTLFKMASNTKPLIATAILQLVDQGKLQLDEPVGKHIPSWANEKVSGVNVRQLLSHTSGLRIPGVFVRPLWTKEQHPAAPSLEAEVDRFATLGIQFEPGTSYSYNNPGFQVLGRLVEVASGQPLKEYLKKSIYEPLGMESSWNYEADAPLERMGRVYAWTKGKRVARWRPKDGPDWPFVRASGGMISTADDYAAFCQMLLNRGTYGGNRILSEQSVSEATKFQAYMATPEDARSQSSAFYGLGWLVDRRGTFSHSGSDGTKAWVDPHRELIVLMFNQSPGGNHPREKFFNAVLAACDAPKQETRPMLRDMGVSIGPIPPGPLNSITDVGGVTVGHRTVIEGEDVRTGVTAIVPHAGNVFQQKVPAAVHVANGFGKFVGTTQIEELGVLETPILLTNTLSTFAAADALISWTLAQPENTDVLSVNPVVGECNDGYLNDIRKRQLTANDFHHALQEAHAGPVVEGCVGAGTGVRCLGWKGGIGTSSRVLPKSLGGYTVGVLVQTNFGGSLTIAGVPIGKALGKNYLRELENQTQEHGSCVVIIATNAPLDARRLGRLARRAPLGLATVGSPITHGSGDYILAFSTDPRLRNPYIKKTTEEPTTVLRDDQMSPLFQAVRDATEEAVVNSLLQAITTTGHKGRKVEAIDPQRVRELLKDL